MMASGKIIRRLVAGVGAAGLTGGLLLAGGAPAEALIPPPPPPTMSVSCFPIGGGQADCDAAANRATATTVYIWNSNTANPVFGPRYIFACPSGTVVPYFVIAVDNGSSIGAKAGRYVCP
jgi:hypothetical protein